MANAQFKIDDREFKRTLEKYQEYTRRTIPEIVNTKAFFIARAAVVYTPKADSSKVRKFFGYDGGRIAGMIINKRRGERGQKGLYGDAMAEAQQMMKAARLRSVAYIKSGWLPAIKTLGGLIPSKSGAMRSEEGNATGRPKQIGQPKGKVSPAKGGGFLAKAIITNMANARHDTKDALMEFGGPALQKAIEHETLSMKVYIEDKMQKAAGMAGVKLTKGGQIVNR